MAYNIGGISILTRSAATATVIADLIQPVFSLPGFSIQGLAGSYVNPILVASSTSSIVNLYLQQVAPVFAPSSSSPASFVYSMNIAGPSVSGGSVGYAYSLYVQPASGSGTVSRNFTACFESGMVGIGTTTPMNTLDVAGMISVGRYAGNTSITASMVISGSLGIGTTTPAYSVDVVGVASASRIFSSQTLQKSQADMIAQGWAQGPFGGGAAGTQRTFSQTNIATFDLSTVNPLSGGFSGGAFDGRYVYFVPQRKGNPATTLSGLITRYDTTLAINSTISYSVFDATIVNSKGQGFSGAVFDGRYLYFVPCLQSNTAAGGVIMRYDATLPFTSSTSYLPFDISAVNSQSKGYMGAVFDGIYIYFTPSISVLQTGTATEIPSGYIARYNTASTFNSLLSYSFFDVGVNINSLCKGFIGGAFDGRYIYYVTMGVLPQAAITANSAKAGMFLSYDTSSTFTNALSYSSFNLSTLNSSCVGFWGNVFDGQYVYCIPNTISNTLAGSVMVQYDTTASISLSSSYKLFDLSSVQSLCGGFSGGYFDGRYITLMPNLALNAQTASGLFTRYDTTRSFTNSASYSTFDAKASVNSQCAGFCGAAFDGTYIYCVPSNVTTLPNLPQASSSLVTRLDAYVGSQLTTLSAARAPQGLVLLEGGNLVLSNAVVGSNAISATIGATVPAQVFTYLVISINGANQLFPVYAN